MRQTAAQRVKCKKWHVRLTFMVAEDAANQRNQHKQTLKHGRGPSRPYGLIPCA